MLKRHEMVELMKDRNVSHVSREIKVGYQRLLYALKGKNPSYWALEALSDYLEAQNNSMKGEKE